MGTQSQRQRPDGSGLLPLGGIAHLGQKPRKRIVKGGHYAILATGCEDVLIDNVTINTGRDGFNLSQCKDVLVANCHIDAIRYEDGHPAGGGDAIKLGSDLSLGKARPCENITVRNCFLASGCNTLQFGTENIGLFKNIRFENIRILRVGKAGISITSNDGSVFDGGFSRYSGRWGRTGARPGRCP
ncbi:MAG: right-handed parallel beta-helix repeat-containing protein [Planctomycetota bacterium]